MVHFQRQEAYGKKCVVEGRDIGSVVFPNAKYKFYLDASLFVRVERRKKEYIKKNIDYWKRSIHTNPSYAVCGMKEKRF